LLAEPASDWSSSRVSCTFFFVSRSSNMSFEYISVVSFSSFPLAVPRAFALALFLAAAEGLADVEIVFLDDTPGELAGGRVGVLPLAGLGRALDVSPFLGVTLPDAVAAGVVDFAVTDARAPAVCGRRPVGGSFADDSCFTKWENCFSGSGDGGFGAMDVPATPSELFSRPLNAVAFVYGTAVGAGVRYLIRMFPCGFFSAGVAAAGGICSGFLIASLLLARLNLPSLLSFREALKSCDA
jgi:hypothetical protein